MPGYVQAVKDAVNLTSRWSDVARKMTSIVTDDTNLNTGDRTSLWASLTAEHEAYGLPLVKVLCIAHRPDLAWKAVSDNVSEVKFLFSKMVVIASYFHSSGVRPRELREVAEENGFQLRELPKLFEVRWSEFNSSLLQSVLVSWRALVKYFEKVHDATSQGYYAFLTKLEHLKLLVFVADLLFVFSRYHKKIQLENFNITDLPDWKSDVIKRLDDLYHSPVLGGWESLFEKQHQPEDNFFMGIKLKSAKETRRRQHHLYVSETTRIFETVRSGILESLKTFLVQRLSFDEDLQTLLKCFISFQAKDEELVLVHRKIACDLPLTDISEEYCDAVRLLGSNSLSLLQKVEILAQASGDYSSLAVFFARIAACTPHSTDVERLISL